MDLIIIKEKVKRSKFEFYYYLFLLMSDLHMSYGSARVKLLYFIIIFKCIQSGADRQPMANLAFIPLFEA